MCECVQENKQNKQNKHCYHSDHNNLKTRYEKSQREQEEIRLIRFGMSIRNSESFRRREQIKIDLIKSTVTNFQSTSLIKPLGIFYLYFNFITLVIYYYYLLLLLCLWFYF